MGKDQHVIPHGDKWAVKGEKNSKATSLHDTQAEAIKAAKEIADNQNSEVVVHRPSGVIREK